MVNDYNQMEWAANPAFKGGEGVFYNKMFIFILEGEGKVLFDDKEYPVKPGEVLYCPEGHSHSLINNGTEDLVFYAVVPKQ